MSKLQTAGAKREYLTADEVKALLDVFNTRYISSYRLKTIIELTVNSGLRVSEIINLKIADIDYIERELYIRNTKREAYRRVPVDKDTLSVVKDYIERAKPLEYVFESNKNTQLSRKSLDRSLKTYGEKAGIKKEKCHFHALRHTYATTLLNDENMQLIEIQELLGHKDIMTTTIYVHVDNRKLKEKRSTKLF